MRSRRFKLLQFEAVTEEIRSENVVVICTKNRPQHLRSLLESVCNQSELVDAVVIVDASTSEASQVVSSHFTGKLNLTYVHSEIASLPVQRNYALRLVRDRYTFVHFFDDDVILHPTYFEYVCAGFAQDLDVVGISGNNVCADPARLSLALRLTGNGAKPGHLSRAGVNSLARGRGDKQVSWLSGCSMSYRLAQIHGLCFDERRVGYALGEDVDFSVRAGARGKLLWMSSATLEHHEAPVERLKMEPFARQMAKHRMLLAHDRLGGVRRWLVVTHAPLAGLHLALKAPVSRMAQTWLVYVGGVLSWSRGSKRPQSMTGT